MEATVLTKVVLPLALALIMLGMGLSLRMGDFSRVLKAPRAFAVGVMAQMVLLPAIGFAVASVFGLPPLLAVGLVILAACPGGTTSNMYAYLAKGDVALSISLTAVISLVTPLTIPIIAALAMKSFMGGEAAIAMPYGKTIVALLAITVVPVGIGMAINRKWPTLAARTEKTLKWFSIAALFAIVAGIAKQNWSQLPGFFAEVGAAALLLNVVAMSAGFVLARVFRLARAETITVGMEVGIQNGTTALFVTGTILANTTMSISPAVYSLLMFGTGAIVALACNGLLPGFRSAAREADASSSLARVPGEGLDVPLSAPLRTADDGMDMAGSAGVAKGSVEGPRRHPNDS